MYETDKIDINKFIFCKHKMCHIVSKGLYLIIKNIWERLSDLSNFPKCPIQSHVTMQQHLTKVEMINKQKERNVYY